MVDFIKQKATTWTPMEVEHNPLKNFSIDQLNSLLGLNIPEVFAEASNDTPLTAPEGFDSRTQWPNCIHPIKDQANCGSCWAFAASEVLEDRICIQGGENVIISAQDIVSCDKTCMGCNGGWLKNVWRYLANHGAALDSCLPYRSQEGVSTQCTDKCEDGSAVKRYVAKDFNSCEKDVNCIKNEIYANGPVETGFTVYNDFFNYAGGIYQHQSKIVAGGHAVKIIGWGVENGVKYWICANSWGDKWGEQGFFRIVEGDSGIDEAVWFGNYGGKAMF